MRREIAAPITKQRAQIGDMFEKGLNKMTYSLIIYATLFLKD